MGWPQIPGFDSASSSADNPYGGSRPQPTGKKFVSQPADDWICKKLERLNLTLEGDYRSRNSDCTRPTELSIHQADQVSEQVGLHPLSQVMPFKKWCDNKLAKLNSAYSQIARASGLSSFSPPACNPISQETLSKMGEKYQRVIMEIQFTSTGASPECRTICWLSWRWFRMTRLKANHQWRARVLLSNCNTCWTSTKVSALQWPRQCCTYQTLCLYLNVCTLVL